MSNISGMVIPNVRPQPAIDPWVFRELGNAPFGDARLTARALRIASDCARNPDLSLASLYQRDWGSLKACYRFFDNTAATPAQILAPHQAATWARCAQEEWVLIAQDTTYFNYTSHPATEVSGPLGRVRTKDSYCIVP